MRSLTLAVTVFIVGCGGDKPEPPAPATTGGPPTAPAPPAAPAAAPKDATPEPAKPIATTKPKATPKPKAIAEPQGEVPAYFMLEPVGVVLEDATSLDVYAVGPTVDRREHRLLASSATPSRSWNGPIRVPQGLEPVNGTETTDDGIAKSVSAESDGAIMALIPAGQYRRGNANGSPEEQPEHLAYVSAFYIDTSEVTLNQYKRFVAETKESGSRVGEPINSDQPGDYPAVGISYRDATAYAEWAGKKIPTEAQWEKAARGSKSLPNVWGRGRPLWNGPREPGQVTAVRQFTGDRSVYGVFDLAGNAREWCRDFWDAGVYEEASREPGGVARDWDGPRRPRQRKDRTVRGTADGWSVTARAGLSSAKRDPLVGFRCVVEFDAEALVASPSARTAPGRGLAPGESIYSDD